MAADRLHLTIGEVLSLLREEFPDVSISKIRFLESQGLVDPERTPSGYRKFYDQDVERLRWILRQQREHFLPLKVIRGRLTGETDGVDAAEMPADGTGPEVDRDALGAAAVDAGVPTGAPVGSGGSVGPAAIRPAPTRAPSPTSAPPPAVAPAIPPTAAAPAGREPAGAAEPEAVPAPEAPPGPAAPPASAPAAPSPRAAARAGAPVPPPAPAGAPVPPSAPAGAPVPPSASPGPTAPTPAAKSPAVGPGQGQGQPDVYTVAELADEVGCTPQLIRDLQQYGILVAGASVGGTPYFDPGAVSVARIGARFAELGVEPRHLRTWRNAADREASLFEQLVMPLLRQRNPQARRQAADRLEELSSLGGELRAGLIAEAVRAIR